MVRSFLRKVVETKKAEDAKRAKDQKNVGIHQQKPRMAVAKRNRSSLRKVSTSKWKTRSSMQERNDSFKIESIDDVFEADRLLFTWEFLEYHRKKGPNYNPNGTGPNGRYLQMLAVFARMLRDDRIVVTKPSMLQDNKERKKLAMDLARLLDAKR